MRPRSDELPFTEEAVVDPSLCVSCGICSGACPTATPFRRRSALAPGIELGDWPMTALRDDVETAAAGLSGPNRILVFTCVDDPEQSTTPDFNTDSVASVAVPCSAAVPPSFIDFVLSRGVAEGVAFTGCGEGNCRHRFGVQWTKARVAGERDPYLRRRVPRERVALLWGDTNEHGRIAKAINAFQNQLSKLPAPAKKPPERETEPEVSENV
jgi:coenzyme F420-reducing hydrogenase delta subunit